MKYYLLLLSLFSLTIGVYSQEKITISDQNSTVKGLKLDKGLSQSFNDAIQRIKFYKRKRYNRLERFPVVGYEYDAGSCLFDIKKLDSFRREINKKLQMIDSKDSVSGFRFYYMAYKKNDDHVPKEFEGNISNSKKIHSLLIVATHCVYYRAECMQTDIIDEDLNIAAFVVDFQNEGTLCPPLPPRYCGGAIIANTIYKSK
jgi:hypothetical protein